MPLKTYEEVETVAPVETFDNSHEIASDLDASFRLVESHGANIRFALGIGWLCWDGRRWAMDRAAVTRFAKDTARKRTLSAVNANCEGRNKRINNAQALESAGHIDGAIKLAESDARVAVEVIDLDRNQWLLNTNNGTLDLRTGILRPHHRDDLITKVAPVDFDPLATHPALAKLLKTVEETCEPGMTDFLARCFGCALTGDASAETLFLLQGDGGAGKTTLIEALSSMLGDYAVKLTFDSFTLSKHGRAPGAASPDLVRLRGSRLAYASEGDQSARFDAGVVKTLTGGEPVTCRALYCEPITFPQTWKLWLVSNFDPRADAEDTGLWRRLLKIRFASVPAEKRDPKIKDALTSDPAAAAALLAWSLRGCLDWQTRGGGRIGLAPPPQIEALTAAYRHEQNMTGQWWADLLESVAVIRPNGQTANRDLRSHYEKWCEENGAMPQNLPRFSIFLAGKGLVKKTTRNGMVWGGVHFSTNY